MPQRGAQHQTDDQAVTAVSAVVARAGATVEAVHKDYGEDLLVQVTLDEVVQPARFWLQVKGTRNSSKSRRLDGSFAVRVEVDRLIRWARSADPVALVLWDVSKDEGWWVWTAPQTDQLEAYLAGSKTKTLRVPVGSRFTPEAVTKMSWSAILERYADAILRAQSAEAFQLEAEQPEANRVRSSTSAPLIFDLLVLLRVVDDEGLSPRFLGWASTAFERFRKDPEFEDDARALTAAVILTMLRAADDRAPGIGVPGQLLEMVCYRLNQLVARDLGLNVDLP